MYRELFVTNDKERLLTYWIDEQHSARWYREANQTDECTEQTFLDWCAKHKLYEINESALLYLARPSKTIVEIHFSVLRGSKCDFVKDLIAIRTELFSMGIEIIHGWIFRANRPLKNLCREIGLEFNGLLLDIPRMGRKPITKECFSVHVGQFSSSKETHSLLNLA